MRIGIIGAGGIAETAIPGFQSAPGVVVGAISARRRDSAEALTAKFGIERAVGDHHELLAMDDIDLVYVATPPKTHYALVLDVIAAGKHVLSEKQFAMNTAEATDMLDRVTAVGLVNAITHPSRYLPAVQAAKRFVADGFLGETYLIKVDALADYGLRKNMPPFYAHWSSRRAEGGGLRDYLCHHLDHIRCIFGDLELLGCSTLIAKKTITVLAPGAGNSEISTGSPPTAGTAPADSYDTAVVHGRVPSGGLVSVTSGWSLNHPTGINWQIYGSAGTLRMQGSAFPQRLEGAATDEADLRSLLPADQPKPNNYTLLANDLSASIADRTHVPTYATFLDGLRLQQILDQIVEPAGD